MNTNLPDTPEVTEPQIILTQDETEAEDDEGRGKRIRKPSQRVVDLLEGHGTWSKEPANSLVPPGVQLMAEEGADDDDLTDWLHAVPAYVSTSGSGIRTG